MKSLVTLGLIAMIVAPSQAVAAPKSGVGISMSGSGTFVMPAQPDLTLEAETPPTVPERRLPASSSEISESDVTQGAAPSAVPGQQDCVPTPPGAASVICD
jgi:hypothetical protein